MAVVALCLPAVAHAGTPPFLSGSTPARAVAAPVAAPPQLIPQPRVQPDSLDAEALPSRRLTPRVHFAPLGAREAPEATNVFEGLSYNDSGGDPPDVTIAAGAGDIVEMTNVVRRVWTAGGAVLQSSSALYQMFGTNNDLLSDPRVLFDTTSGRWFASVMDISTGTIVVAASTTASPLAAWNTWTLSIPESDDCFDQPKLGSSDGMILVTASAYSRREGLCAFVGFFYTGGVIFALNKQELMSGAPARWSLWGPDTDYNIPVAAQDLSPSTTAYAISNYSSSVGVFAISGTPPSATLATTFLHTSAFDNPPPAVQPGSAGIATNDDRLLDAFWSNGNLWSSGNAACLQSDGLTHACARVVEVSTALGSLDVDTAVQEPGGDTYYPALRPDGSGNVVVVYGVSSPTVFPSVAVVVRGGDGTWSAPQLVRTGTVSLNLPRFGDYFGAARDTTLPNIVWIGGEYIGSGYGYQTAVGAVRTVQLAPAVAYGPSVAPGPTSATVNGFVDPQGADSTYWFEYGGTTAYGHATVHLAATAVGGRLPVSSILVGLAAGRTYHWRLVAANDAGTTGGADQQLRTAKPKPRQR